MKKMLLSIAAVSAVAAATVPAIASAQPYHGQGGDRVARLDQRIDMGIRSGGLNRNEAWRLKGDLRETARLEARYSRDGLSRWERADLDRRFDRISAQIRVERRDRDYGRDRDHGYDPRR
jgi:hypothetical protein